MTTTAPPIRVLCIEDQRSFNEAMKIALSVEDDIECVASVETVAEGLALLDQDGADVVLMDIDLPDVDGIEGTRRVKALRPETSVVVLTGLADLDMFVRAVAAGADGFLAKDTPFESILAAIRHRSADGMQIDDHTISSLRTRVQNEGALEGRAWAPELTDREREVLALLGAGLDPQTIARQLGIRIHTCRGYVRNVLMKLGAHSQLEAVAVARQAGLLEGF
ncbi:MAG TPA: response regulator transcription factor [Acidimicrobiales bacterium]|nr:response regulator transcription factor [Acidimicrobiales bacterium]